MGEKKLLKDGYCEASLQCLSCTASLSRLWWEFVLYFSPITMELICTNFIFVCALNVFFSAGFFKKNTLFWQGLVL